MRKTLALLLCGLASALATTATDAPCSIQHAAAAGQHIWLLCQRDELFVSADEGMSWQARRLPSDARFRAIAFLDSRRGFVAGDGGVLLATEDGGESWRQVPLLTNENLTSICFVGELGWLAGWSGLILHSTDGGKTWVRQPSGVLQGIERIFFAGAKHGWAVGWVGTILRTTDGGQTWEEAQTRTTFSTLSSVYFRDAKHGWAVGFGGQILKSSDGGRTWEHQESPVQAWLTSVLFEPSGRGWIAAETNSQLLLSDDEGESWRTVPVESTLFPHQLLRLGGSLWAVGRFGVLKQSGPGPEFQTLAILSKTDLSGS